MDFTPTRLGYYSALDYYEAMTTHDYMEDCCGPAALNMQPSSSDRESATEVINLFHLSIYLTPSLHHHLSIRLMSVRWVHIGFPQRQNSFTRDFKGRYPTLCSNAAMPRGCQEHLIR
jgi:hypothetical protein